MKKNISAFTVGFIFAIGLCVSGMTQTQKIVGFLDIFGNWDPSLLFVMVGAIFVHGIAYRIIIKRKSPIFSLEWHLPDKKEITPALVIGAMLFGVGWGLGGYCPGPAIVAVGGLQQAPLVLLLGMIFGMLAFNLINKILKLKL